MNSSLSGFSYHILLIDNHVFNYTCLQSTVQGVLIFEESGLQEEE